MKKKLIASIVTLVMMVGLMAPNVVGDTQWGDDSFGANLAFYICDESGNRLDIAGGTYQLGDYFYFKYDLWASSIEGETVVNKINIRAKESQQSGDTSDFQYFNGTSWVDASTYIGDASDKTPTKLITNNMFTRFRIRFNRDAKYLIDASCVELNDKFGYISSRFLEIEDGRFAVSREEPTTQAPATEEPTTTQAPTTSVVPTSTQTPTTVVPTTKEQQTTTKEQQTTTKKTPVNIVVPGLKSVKKIAAKKKSLKVTWIKVNGVNGYQLQYSLKKTFKKAKLISITKSSTLSKTIKKLKKKKKYYVRIRTYKNVAGKMYFSKWSKAKSKKTK